jgi:hypothetical protein
MVITPVMVAAFTIPEIDLMVKNLGTNKENRTNTPIKVIKGPAMGDSTTHRRAGIIRAVIALMRSHLLFGAGVGFAPPLPFGLILC